MSRSDLTLIEQAVRNNIERCFPGTETPLFVAGVSGGVDSMSLLHTFKKLGVSAVVSHVNYQKRGAEADRDAEMVERVAAEWGFECHIEKVDPREAEGQNFQQWARDVRYERFRKLAEQYNARAIAVAHHEDDQAETILQKLFRGAGLASWSGMQVWDGEIFRPLLPVSREQIEQYASREDIPFRTDVSNLESEFARNLLRNKWLDKLSEFFPGWKSNVLQAGEQARHYGQAIRWIADTISDSRGVKIEAFHTLEPGVQKALILHLVKRKQPGIEISRASLNRVEELRGLQAGQEIELSAGIAVHRDRNHYVIKGEEPSEEFRAVTFEKEQFKHSPVTAGEIRLAVEKYENPDFSSALYLDANKLSWPVRLRRWQPGDRIQPLGMEGHQSVADHLANRKISSAYKSRALVVESFEETICAIIFPPIKNKLTPGTIAEQVKCDSGTEYCLKIKPRN